MQNRILRRPEVSGQTGLSRSQLYALIKQGRFPRQVKLSERCCGWIEADVQRWIAERIASAKVGT